MNSSPENIHGGYTSPSDAYTTPAAGLGPHNQVNIPDTQSYPTGPSYTSSGAIYPTSNPAYPTPTNYPPTAQAFPPVPRNPPYPQMIATGPPQTYEMQTMQPPALSNMGAPAIVQTPAKNIVKVERKLYYGPKPIVCVCPHCSKEMKTKIKKRPTPRAWITCAALVCTGLCLIPFCLPWFYVIIHRCSNCGKKAGVYYWGSSV